MEVLIKPSFSKQTRARVKYASKVFGVPEKEFVQRAVLYFLDRMQKDLNLKGELHAWEDLGQEAWATFEKRYPEHV